MGTPDRCPHFLDTRPTILGCPFHYRVILAGIAVWKAIEAPKSEIALEIIAIEVKVRKPARVP